MTDDRKHHDSHDATSIPTPERAGALHAAPERFQPERPTFLRAVRSFFRAPFELGTWTGVAYLALAFPLGLLYFVFLVVGLPLAAGLLIIWIGLPLLALVLAGGWGFAAFERETANRLLGASVPPMRALRRDERTFLERIGDHLSNRVTWTSFAFLMLKLPLGLATFVALTVAGSLSVAFLAAPVLYRSAFYGLQFDTAIGYWRIDTLPEALLVALFGLVCCLVTIQLARGMGFLWGRFAALMLGSEEHRAAPARERRTEIERVYA